MGQEEAFLGGGGEMGELMRRRDWASTPLNEAAHWPGAFERLSAPV
jgi:hypothetical protein